MSFVVEFLSFELSHVDVDACCFKGKLIMKWFVKWGTFAEVVVLALFAAEFDSPDGFYTAVVAFMILMKDILCHVIIQAVKIL